VGATKRTVNARLKDQKGYSYREYDEQLMPARTRAQAEKSGSKLSMPTASAQIQINILGTWVRAYFAMDAIPLTVYGLNGRRSHYIISLFKVTYKSTIQISRNFHALFIKALENFDTCD
jgi:hypothetical protein